MSDLEQEIGTCIRCHHFDDSKARILHRLRQEIIDSNDRYEAFKFGVKTYLEENRPLIDKLFDIVRDCFGRNRS